MALKSLQLLRGRSLSTLTRARLWDPSLCSRGVIHTHTSQLDQLTAACPLSREAGENTLHSSAASYRLVIKQQIRCHWFLLDSCSQQTLQKHLSQSLKCSWAHALLVFYCLLMHSGSLSVEGKPEECCNLTSSPTSPVGSKQQWQHSHSVALVAFCSVRHVDLWWCLRLWFHWLHWFDDTTNCYFLIFTKQQWAAEAQAQPHAVISCMVEEK